MKLKFKLMCGLPASGKSTYLETHFRSYVRVSLDEIRRVFFGHQFHQNAEPFVIGTAKNMVRLLLEQGKNVILDSTATRFDFRQDWRNVAESCGAECEIIWIDTPKVICLERNKKRPKDKRVPKHVIERMALHFQNPNFCEEMLLREERTITVRRIVYGK